MSNWKQATLAVVGAVVGYVAGGPQGAYYGAQIGLLAGSALFPGKLPGVTGPRLADNGTTESQVGAPIPWVFGTQVIGGIVVWASPVREEEQTESVGGGGSAPSQDMTSYHYFRSWGVLLTDGEIAGIRRIWFNGKLRLDRTPQGATEEDAAFRSRIMANEAFMGKVTVYLGTEDQLPDPTIESFEGVGNVPGYRGYSLVVFNDLELVQEDGQRMPAQMQFEVYTRATSTQEDATQYSTTMLFPWISSAQGDPTNHLNLHRVASVLSGGNNSNPAGAPWSSVAEALAAKTAQTGREYTYIMGTGLADFGTGILPPGFAAEASGFLSSMGGPTAESRDAETICLHYNVIDFTQIKHLYSTAGLSITYNPPQRGLDSGQPDFVLQDEIFSGSESGSSINIRGYFSGAGIYPSRGHPWTAGAAAINFEDTKTRYSSAITDSDPAGTGDTIYRLEFNSAQVTYKREVRPPWNPCDDPRSIHLNGYDNYVVLNGELQRCGDWTYLDSSSDPPAQAKVLSQYEASNNVVTRYPLNPTRPISSPDYIHQAFWDAAYADAVTRGDLPAGMTYSPTGAGGINTYPRTQAWYYTRDAGGEVIEIENVTLQEIVEAICARVGVKVNLRYDASELTTEVIGFKVGTPMTARAAIDPLRSVGFFDAVEDGIVLRFPVRGKAPVDELEELDLGAFFAEQGRGPMVSTQKLLELDLPRQIRVHYQDPERDFDPGEESSPVRVDTRAQSVVDVELAVAITADQAAQIADVLLRDSWAGRYSYTSQVDVSKAHLQPADVVLLPVDGIQERVRMENVQDVVPNLRVIQFARDDDGAYSSTAVGSSGLLTPPKLVVYGPVEAVLLDLPVLNVETETPDNGFYAAARPLIPGGAFSSLTLLRSADDSLFAQAARIVQATPMGQLVSDLDSGQSTVVDNENEIVVDMLYGEPESASLEDVLAGANMAAIGADGRWEICQWVNAEFLYVTSGGLRRYRLYELLRGRRGTEWYRGALAGDQLVFLSAGTLGRVQLPAEFVNRSLYYRALGGPGSPSSDSFQFTGYGKNLQPFAPVHVHGTIDEDHNWVLTWDRRDRMATDIDVPLSESTEAYEVDVLLDGVVIRTITALETTATYTADKQVVDFGVVQASLTLHVYQTSAAVGRSNPIEVQLP